MILKLKHSRNSGTKVWLWSWSWIVVNHWTWLREHHFGVFLVKTAPSRDTIHYYWVSIVFVVCKYSLLWNEMKLCWNSVWFIVSFHFISLSESAKRGNVYCSISRLQMYSIIRAINLNNIVWNTKPFWSFRKREIYNWNWISCEIKFLLKLPV